MIFTTREKTKCKFRNFKLFLNMLKLFIIVFIIVIILNCSESLRMDTTCSDRHYVKKIIFSLDYCFLSMFSIFVVLFDIVLHLLMSCHNFSLFIRVPCILFYGDLLTLKTHHYKPNSMNSLNSMKELLKNWNERINSLGPLIPQ